MATRPSLEEILQNIPFEKLDEPCRDEHLSDVAFSLIDWRSIAPFLGFTEFEERELTIRYPHDLSVQNIAMLRQWRAKVGHYATYRCLITVLWNRGKTALAEQVCTMVENASAATESFYTLDSYAKYLKGRYSRELPKFSTVQWPPPPTSKVFNLAIIERETIQRVPVNDEYVQQTLRGKVGDIMKTKSPIELKNLFKLDSRRRKIILIEGAPGAGKSTLAWHICQEWESGELFQEFKIVVFVQLRDPAIQSAMSLADILPAKSRNMCMELQSLMEIHNGCGVLFVLDGWDEYGPGLQTHSPIEQLICSPEKMNMHFNSLIITSRPIASGELQRYASSRVEIVGFTSTEIKKYFNESISNSETVQKLQDLLRERPVIEASCYLPLNAAIVVHLFLALNHTLPHTLHEVFLSLVLCCIIRHLTREAEEGEKTPDISSLDDLPPDVHKSFTNICTMAYHAVMENKATFSAVDLQSSSTLSLLQGVQSFTAFKTSFSYYFLHLSIQELLAAFHISKLAAPEQIQIFNDLFGKPRLAAVFQFYAAFTKLQTVGVRDTVARIVHEKQKPLLVNLLHGLYEAQDVSLCKFVASHLNGKFNLYGNTLGPIDCLVVGYFISCVLPTSGIFEANLGKCSIDDYRISFLVRELSKCSSSFACFSLNLSDNDFSDGGAVRIAEILRYKNYFKMLDVSRCGIGDQGIRSIASALQMNSSMEEFGFSGNTVTGVGLMALGESLKMNGRLKTLLLYMLANVSENDWKLFILCLQENCHLERLLFSHYSVNLCEYTSYDVMQQEKELVNRIRREKNLPLLNVIH